MLPSACSIKAHGTRGGPDKTETFQPFWGYQPELSMLFSPARNAGLTKPNWHLTLPYKRGTQP
jgi:hypothetical protein